MMTTASPFSTSIRLGMAAVLLSFSVAGPSSAETAGTIEGSVIDANGNALPGVALTVTGAGVRQEHVTCADWRLHGRWTGGG